MSLDPDVRAFVAALLADRGDQKPFADGDSLVTSGRLDSVAVMEIVAFLEDDRGIDFAEVGFEPADFDSLAAIAELLARAPKR